MRVPPEAQIYDVVFGGTKTLKRDTGDNWFVYGGFHSAADKLTPVPSFTSGKSGIANVHITVPYTTDLTATAAASLPPGGYARATNFHVTFVFDMVSTKLRLEYLEVPGTATLQDQDGKTLTELIDSKKPISTGIQINNDGSMQKPDVDDLFGKRMGKQLKWNIGDLSKVADRIALQFYSQCLY